MHAAAAEVSIYVAEGQGGSSMHAAEGSSNDLIGVEPAQMVPWFI